MKMSETGVMMLFCFSIIVVIICLIYYRKQRQYKRCLATIPGPPAKYPFIGNMDLFLKGNGHAYNRFYDTVTDLCAKYSNFGIFKLKFGPKYGVFIFRKHLIREYFKIKSGLQKPSEYQIVNRWLGKALPINTDYSEWKQKRRLLLTVFHSKLVEGFITVFNEKSNILIKELKKRSKDKHIDITPILFSCTFDVICGTMLGIPMNTLQNQNTEYIKACHRLITHVCERLYKPWFQIDFIYNLTKRGKEWIRDIEFVHKFTENVINKRKQQLLENRESDIDFENNINEEKTLVFLDLLIDIHLKDNSLTLKEVRDEVNTFMYGGHDTTACTLSWTLFLIGLHPEVQQKLQNELDAIINRDDDITCDHIKQMSYLDAVIKESMRVYTPVPMIGRQTLEDIQLGEHKIPKGVTIYFLITNLHQDAKAFPDPEQFKPERFLVDNLEEFDAYSYAPFSLGVQNCMGKTYALNEMKIILAKLLTTFEFKSIDKRSDVLPINIIVCKPEKGIKMSIKLRD